VNPLDSERLSEPPGDTTSPCEREPCVVPIRFSQRWTNWNRIPRPDNFYRPYISVLNPGYSLSYLFFHVAAVAASDT